MTKDINDDGTVDWLDSLDVNWDEGEEMCERVDPETLKPSPECADMTEHFEGFSSKPYYDSAGHLTWGIGETEDVDPNGTISYDEAVERFLMRLEKDYGYWVGKKVKVPLYQHEYDALACFTYNLGVGNLTNSTLLRKLNQGDYEGAAEEFLEWNKARVDGELVELAGLTRRRKAEREMFLGRDWRKFYS